MAKGFTKNAHRVDPYKNFKFRIIMDEKPVMGVSKVGALKRSTDPVLYRSGGDDPLQQDGGIADGVEQRVEMIVREFAPLEQRGEPRAVAADNQEHRRLGDPMRAVDALDNLPPQGIVAHPDHIRLLQVALGWDTEPGRKDQPH